MLKQIISLFVIIALSAAVVFLMPQAQQALQLLVSGHDWVAEILKSVFNGDQAGNLARELVALMVIPLIAGLVPAINFFIVRKSWLGCFMEIVWIVWLLQVGGLVMVYGEQPVAATIKPAPASAKAKKMPSAKAEIKVEEEAAESTEPENTPAAEPTPEAPAPAPAPEEKPAPEAQPAAETPPSVQPEKI